MRRPAAVSSGLAWPMTSRPLEVPRAACRASGSCPGACVVCTGAALCVKGVLLPSQAARPCKHFVSQRRGQRCWLCCQWTT